MNCLVQESSRKWCKRNYLEEQRLYEMAKLRKQFRDILLDSKLISAADADEDERRQVTKENRAEEKGKKRKRKKKSHLKMASLCS